MTSSTTAITSTAITSRPPITAELGAYETGPDLKSTLLAAYESLQFKLPNHYRKSLFDLIYSDMKVFDNIGHWTRERDRMTVEFPALYPYNNEYEVTLYRAESGVSEFARGQWKLFLDRWAADTSLCFSTFPKSRVIGFRIAASDGGVPALLEAWLIKDVFVKSVPSVPPPHITKFGEWKNGEFVKYKLDSLRSLSSTTAVVSTTATVIPYSF